MKVVVTAEGMRPYLAAILAMRDGDADERRG